MRPCCPNCWPRSPIPDDEPLGTVTADGTYDTKACYTALATREACPVIPVRRNARPWKGITPGEQLRNEALRATRRFGRANWKTWTGYHRRSRVETKMHCLKLMGERLMARDFDRQVAEFHVCAAIMNRFTQLGTPKTSRIA